MLSNAHHMLTHYVRRSIEEQRDLNVQIQRSLKAATQVESIIKKAYGILASNTQGLQYKTRGVMLQPYKTLVRH